MKRLTLLCFIALGAWTLREALELLWRPRNAPRFQLAIALRAHTFCSIPVPSANHISASLSSLIIVWILVLALGLRRRHRWLRAILLLAALFSLCRWMWDDWNALDVAAQVSRALHHMVSVVTPEYAETVIKSAADATRAAEAGNATDHDWLHAVKLDTPLSLFTPDVIVPFPWSFVVLGLVILGTASLSYRYTIHWAPSGRIRFVPRYIDPADEDGKDTWENVPDSPALEIEGEKEVLWDRDEVDELELAFSPTTLKEMAKEPLFRFPISDPSPEHLEQARDLRKMKSRRRVVANRVINILVAVILLNDLSYIYRVYETDRRISKGLMHPEYVILEVDVAELPAVADNVTEVGAPVRSADHRFPDRPIPRIRPHRAEYAIPLSCLVGLFYLFQFAIPPFIPPRTRLLVYTDRLVAIPLRFPTRYITIPFDKISGIDVRVEDSTAPGPPGTAPIYRYRRYPGDDESSSVSRRLRLLRGYLYAGVGDLGAGPGSIGAYSVLLRCVDQSSLWGVSIQGMDIESCRDLLAGVLDRYHVSRMSK